MQGGLRGGVYPESYMRDSARCAIHNEVVPTRCRGTAALNRSADETRTPASQCLPAMPFPEAASADYPPLNLESWLGRQRGGRNNTNTGLRECAQSQMLTVVTPTAEGLSPARH
jgi:hypothetical protein